MTYTPIVKGAPDWDVPLNAALTSQDSRITVNEGTIASQGTAISNNTTNIATNTADILLRMVKTANLSDVANVATARTNLGLGGAAVLNVGTTAGTVAAGDDSRIVNAVPKSTLVVNVMDFGALNNNTGDQAAAINSAIAALGATGGILYFPPGDFRLGGSANIALTAPITLQGAGPGATTIRISSAFSGASGITVSSDDCVIKDIQIRGGSTTTTSNPVAIGVTATGVQSFRVLNSTFLYINGYAIKALGTAGVTLHGGMIDNVKIQSCAGGVWIKSDTTNTAANFQISNLFTRFTGVNSGGSANLDCLRIEDSWDVLVQNAFTWMNATTGGTGAAFRVRGDCAATFVQNLDALGPQTGAANVIIEGNGTTSPQNVQIAGGVIQQGLIGILISDASNQVRVRNMRILNNQTHNISITTNGSGLTGGIYFDECAISQAGQVASGTNYDVNWTGTAEGSITDCRFGTEPVSIGTAGPQGTINIASAQVRVLNALFAWNSGSYTTIYPGISPQLSTAARPDETRFEFRGTANWNMATGERLSLRPTATGNQALATNVGAGANDNFRLLGSGTQEFGAGGASARDTTWGRIAAAQVGSSDSDITAALVGKGFRIKEGTNSKMGQATLVAGTVTVTNTSVTTASRVFVTRRFVGGTPGFESVSVAAGSFTITSSNGADTSGFNWVIFEPAP